MTVQRSRLNLLLLLLLLALAACGKSTATPQPAPVATAAGQNMILPVTAAPNPPPTQSLPPSAASPTAAQLPAAASPAAAPVQPGSSPLATPTPIALYGWTDTGFYRLGSADAPVVVYGYADFLCTACRDYVMTVEPQLIEKYIKTGQVQLAFQPVLDFNPRSQLATEAAYCAGHQRPELFWALHDVIFARQPELWATDDVAPVLKQFAAEVGVDQTLFSDCLDNHMFAAEIQASDQARRDEGVRQRPTFKFVSDSKPEGQMLAGAQSFEALEKLVVAALGH